MIKILFFLGITFFANPVYAACTGPVGAVGDVIFNTTNDVLQGCTKRGWFAFHEALTCKTGPIGTACADGAIYAGISSGNRIYAAAADETATYEWKTSFTTTAGTGSNTDGVANTDAMAVAGIALHPAAQACRNHGAEWYLPARDELDDALYTNRAAIGGFSTDFYWSSTESNTTSAPIQCFSDGFQVNTGKTTPFRVRCVRR